MRVEASFNNRDRFITLGITIAAVRKLRGMSQIQLAEKANVSRSHLAAIESTNTPVAFSLEILYNIADALGVEAADLLSAKLPG